uniref:S2-RNase n=1 Tax=Citrus limon TaxID=2708 RepID=A0A9E8K063_CITLI|nr:S2-RNase [Citrus x limon]
MKVNLLLAVIPIFYMFYAAMANSSQFSYFWLVQTWPYGFCLQVHCVIHPPIFVLHGLWPVDSRGQTLEGTNGNRKRPEILDAVNNDPPLADNMEKYWPSLTTRNRTRRQNFWIYQWQAHGSAQTVILEPLEYFRKAMQLTMYTDLRNTLNAKGIAANGTSYAKTDFRKAIREKTGHTPILSCISTNDGERALKEVTLCVNYKATNFIPCNQRSISTESCRQENIKFPTRPANRND